MNNIVEHGDELRFAIEQSPRNLRDNGALAQRDAEDLREQMDSSDGFKALRRDSDEDIERRIELPSGVDRKRGTSGGGPSWFGRISKRVLLIALLILAFNLVWVVSIEQTILPATQGFRQAWRTPQDDLE